MADNPVMSDRGLDNWMTQLRKGALELCILNAIRDQSLYGYDIVRTLREVDGLMISEGTIYPILSRLKKDALARTTIEESPEGPARKYYHLTEHGRQELDRMNRYWQELRDGIDSIVDRGGIE
jgi:PadR family transcriptional regulator PadR